MSEYNIAQCLHGIVKEHGGRTGLMCPAGSSWHMYKFRELSNHAHAFAHGLAAQGVKAGDRVVLMVRPGLEFYSLTFALFGLGAVVILIDPGMGYRNLLRCVGRVRPDIFIGIPAAWMFRHLFPAPFVSVRRSFLIVPGMAGKVKHLSGHADFKKGAYPCFAASRDDLAAIIFTTGSTGPPKGVRYPHGVFSRQLELIRDYYGIGPSDRDQPAFPLFGLFSVGLGASVVIPDMNPAHPARVNPEKFIRSILKHKVTYSFGSPAIWRVVSSYCLAHRIKLSSLRCVLMAGAPVPGDLIEAVTAILPSGAIIHTPFGATESLPVASITGREILAETWKETQAGKGVCVGLPLPGNAVRIIEAVDGPISDPAVTRDLPAGEIGEILVQGPIVTREYDNNEPETSLAVIGSGETMWRRMGDMGYLDASGRLWFCGRKAHRVLSASGVLYTIPCEAIFNRHPDVRRTAIVGVGEPGSQVPVLIAEPKDKPENPKQLLASLRRMAGEHPLTAGIEHFLIHPSFPVDIRHNAKIFREQLAVWAAERLDADSAAHCPRGAKRRCI